MPTVEKTVGGRVNVRGIGEFERGDTADVSEGDAEYLVEERGDFEYVENSSDDQEDDVDVCGADLSDGGTCDRPADECPYHGDDQED